MTAPPAFIQLATHQESLEPETAAFDAPSLQRFARHIQPLLINRCGSCHASDSDRQWTLVLPSRGSRASARITQENLSAIMSYIDPENPGESQLRARAVDGHAGKSATLGPRAPVPTRALDHWLRHVRPATPAVNQSAKKLAPEDADETKGSVPQADDVDDPGSDSSAGAGGVKRLPVVANPFDPELFNRRFHGSDSAAPDSVAEAK
jgi:hypothetical protein